MAIALPTISWSANITETTTHADNIASGSIEENISYVVSNIDASFITYNSSNYYDGEIFVGVSGITTYTESGTSNIYIKYNYTCRVIKDDPNDPGYGTLAVGYYIVDFIGHIFEIMEINYGGDAEVVRAYDLIEDTYSYGPYNNKISYIYDSLHKAALLSQAKLNRLDGSAEDYVRSLGLDPKVLEVDGIQYNMGYSPVVEPEGLTWWNVNENTLNMATGYGSTLQVGQEIHIKVYNNTGSDILDGTAVYPNGSFNNFPTIGKAQTNTHETVSIDYGMTTTDILNGEYGFVTWFGKVRGLDTSSYNLGDVLYISPDTAGGLVNVRPELPDYAIQMGIVFNVDANDGEIFITSRTSIYDTLLNFYNGTFRESFDFLVSSSGGVVTGSLSPTDGHPDMTMIFSDGFELLDTTPAIDIVLTVGTDTNPQSNYIYVPKTTKVLTLSTSDWPASEEHIRVAHVVLQSAATTEINGALRNQNWNDHMSSTDSQQGHMAHISEKVRQFEAQWYSGIEGSATDNGGVVYVKNTAGDVYQMHRQIFPMIDMTQYDIDAVSTGSKTFTISGDGDLSSVFPDDRIIKVNNSTGNDGLYTIVSTVWSDPDFIITVEESISSAVADGTIGDDIHIVNHDTTPYTTLIDLADVTNDASGNSLNNTSFSIVVWGIQNKTGQECHLMANLPTDTYNKNFPAQAVSDATNFSVYTIPKSFQSVGFLIARFTFVNSGGTWSIYDTEDLRGKIPNSTAGGGAGGTGVTTFLGLSDTPSAYTSQALKIPQVNVGETALEFVDQTWTVTGSDIYYNTGNVGIGTATPNQLLSIASSGTTTFKVSSTSTQNPKILFNTSASETSNTIGATIQAIRTDDGGSGSTDLVFSNGLASTITERIRILANGNVGINDTSPSYKLDVNGTGRFTGNLLLDSDFGFSTAGITTIDRILDEDNMVSNSAVALATQQSIKAYVDTSGGLTIGNTGQIPFSDTGTPGTDFDYSANLTWTSGTSTLLLNGTLDHNGTYVGFFGATPVIQQPASPPDGTTAGATYGAVEQALINSNNDAIQYIWDALEALGLIYSPA